MAPLTPVIPSTPEQREQAVQILVTQMTGQGMDTEEAATVARKLVALALVKRGEK
jgi:hypothetical protein